MSCILPEELSTVYCYLRHKFATKPFFCCWQWLVCRQYTQTALLCFHGSSDVRCRWKGEVKIMQSFRIISSTNFDAQFSLFINNMFVTLLFSTCFGINMPIFRRKNCIHTASGIVAFCKRLHSTLVESEDARCCVNTIFSPEDGHVNARKMSRIIV